LDEQAIFEGALTLKASMLEGGNMIHDMGYMESGLTYSLELLVIQDEIVSWIKACTEPFVFSEETLALDLVHKHAHDASFLETKHTLRHVRDGWKPRLVDRNNYDRWKAKGGTSMRDRARAVIDEILAEEPRQALPPEIARQVTAIADRAVADQTG
jgi:trimethylamine--corrinoid protein Co-methyltransferase